jgi:hypothetical protein
VPPTDAAGTPRPPPVWCTSPGTAAPRPQKRSGSKRIPPLPILCSGSAKGERAAEKPAGFPAGSSSCNNYKKRFANVRTRCPLPRPLRVRPQAAPSLCTQRFCTSTLSSPVFPCSHALVSFHRPDIFSGKQHDKSSQNCHLH